MIKSFLNGIGFGFGFCLAIGIVILAVSQFGEPISEKLTNATTKGVNYKERNKWNELGITEKIRKSSAIAIVRFRKEEEGLNSAYIEKAIKRESSTKLGIKIGDRVEQSDFYSQGGMNSDRNGVVIFYVRNPAIETAQSYLYDDRLIGEGDMPLDIFLKKYKEID